MVFFEIFEILSCKGCTGTTGTAPPATVVVVLSAGTMGVALAVTASGNGVVAFGVHSSAGTTSSSPSAGHLVTSYYAMNVGVPPVHAGCGSGANTGAGLVPALSTVHSMT